MPDVFVYALCEPDTGAVRYVGISTNPQDRLRQHLLDKQNAGKRAWLDGLLARGLRPSLLILEQITDNSWPDAERRWIDAYRKQGADLTNKSEYRAGIPPEKRMLAAKSAKPLPHLRAWRKVQRLSRDKLAELSGISCQTIWRAETGSSISFSNARKLADALHLTPKQFLSAPKRARSRSV